ncbi:MAG: alpha/beta hydrolase, partial [Bacteroidota bacterium]|nr:alpha/beta hydrolase [Bacteroidota bacterium]
MKTALPFIVFLVLSSLLYGQTNFQKLKSEYDSLIKSTNYGHNPLAGKYYTIRGFKMYCEVYGTGEPLLMIHGNGGSIHDFVKQIPYFSKRYKVVVADSRAQGKSVDKNDSLTYEMMADDYAALLNA